MNLFLFCRVELVLTGLFLKFNRFYSDSYQPDPYTLG